jgi:predicted permease
MSLFARLRLLGPALFRHARIEDEMDEELRAHIRARADDLECSGLPRTEAERRARLEFGGYERFKEECRDAIGVRLIETLVRDLRYGIRMLHRSVGFTTVILITMALGIGANSAVFSALDTTFWKPLPVDRPEMLVTFSILRNDGAPEKYLPAPFIRQLRESGIFSGIVARQDDGLSFAADGRAERILGEFVSPRYFSLLGVGAFLGQPFSQSVQAGHWGPEAVLSYGFWKARFGGDPGVIGRTIRLNTYPFTIVGVSPPSFLGLVRGTDYQLRIPLLPDGATVSQIAGISGAQDRWLNATARLRPGSTRAEAEAETDAQFQWFLRRTPVDEFRRSGLRRVRVSSAARGYSQYVDEFSTPLSVLFVLAGIVLLISCANVANMLLARSAARAKEIAVRVSIGAGRFCLLRQLLTESLLLALGGSAVGIVLATFADGALVRLLPQGHVPLVLELRPDGRVLVFTIALTLLVGLAFGLVPALQATRGDLIAAMRTDSAVPIGAGRGGLRTALAVAQVGFSLALLVAAGTFARSLSSLRGSDFHTDPRRVVLFTMKPQEELYSDQQKRLLVQELIRRVSALPGVESAAFAEYGPLGSRTNYGTVGAPGRDPLRVDIDYVTPGFFDIVGVERLSGRDFSAVDLPGSPPVAIINQSLAGVLFGRANPIGRVIVRPQTSQQFQIIGVVADSHYYDLHGGVDPGVWFAILQDAPYMPTLEVQMKGFDLAGTIAAVQRQFDGIDQGFPVFNIKTFAMRIEDSLAGERMLASLSGAFGLTALIVAAVGLYGVLAYSVSRRTREIGIRVALGAERGDVFRMILGQGLRLAAIGIGVGLLVALPAMRVVRSFLYGIEPAGPLVFAAVSVGVLATALLSCYVPARRAMRLDPNVALRHD